VRNLTADRLVSISSKTSSGISHPARASADLIGMHSKREISPLEAIDRSGSEAHPDSAEENKFYRIESSGARVRPMRKVCFELRLTDPKIDKIFRNICRKVWARAFARTFDKASPLDSNLFAAVQFPQPDVPNSAIASLDLTHPLGRHDFRTRNHLRNSSRHICVLSVFGRANSCSSAASVFGIEIEVSPHNWEKRMRADLASVRHRRFMRGGQIAK